MDKETRFWHGTKCKIWVKGGLTTTRLVTGFLVVQNSSIGDLVTDSVTQSITFDFDITEWLVTFETFDQSDEKRWPDQKIPTYQNTYPLTYLATYLCSSIREHPKGAIMGICDNWDTDYNIYWQLRTWINDNLCYLIINCDTGQHSQFLRCFWNPSLKMSG